MALFTVTDKQSGASVDVFDVRSTFIASDHGGVKTAEFFVYDVRVGQFKWVLSNLFSDPSGGYTPVVRVQAVQLDVFNITLDIGGSAKTVNASIIPADAANQNVTWEISDDDYVDITPSGLTCSLTAKRPGRVTLTCTSEDNNRVATCQVFVLTDEIYIDTIDFLPATMTIGVGDVRSLTALTGPSNADDRVVTFTIIDGGDKVRLSPISNNFVDVIGDEEGVAHIRATARDAGGFSADYTVTVVDYTTLDVSNYTELVAALANQAVQTINVTGNIQMDDTLTINRSITLNANYFNFVYDGDEAKDGIVVSANNVIINDLHLRMTDNTVNWQGHYGLHVYNAVGVILNGLNVGGEDSGILINGSTVTMNGTVDVSANEFGGIEVSRGTGVSRNSTLTITNADFENSTESYSHPTIWVVNGQGSVVGAGSLYSIQLNGQTQYYIDEENTRRPGAVTGITLGVYELTLEVGETNSINAYVAPNDAIDKSVTWSRTGTAVSITSSTDDTCTFTADFVGVSNITATTVDGGFMATCRVTVVAAVIPVTGVTLDRASMTVAEGSGSALTATLSPADATNKNVTWSKQNDNINITPNGLTCGVIGVTEGSSRVTVTAQDGNWTDTCDITIEEAAVPVTGVSINPSTVDLLVPYGRGVNAVITPTNATIQGVSWASSNPAIATVEDEGNLSAFITAVAEGSTTITVTTDDGGFTGTCNVSVEIAVIPVTGVTLDQPTLNMSIGEQITLTATIAPSDASDRSVGWAKTGDGIAIIPSGLTCEVEAIEDGTGTVVVTTNDGNFTATSNYTVDSSAPHIPVTGLAVNPNRAHVDIGSTLSIGADIYPPNATNQYIEWTSSNDSIATVEADSPGGLTATITGVADGSAIITATSQDGGYSADCALAVGNDAILVLSPDNVFGNNGDVVTVEANFVPDTFPGEIEWQWGSGNIVATLSVSEDTKTATLTFDTGVNGYGGLQARSVSNPAITAIAYITSGIQVADISINPSVVVMTNTDIATITAFPIPSNASNPTMVWEVSNNSWVDINTSGGNDNTITVTPKSSSVTADGWITVYPQSNPALGKQLPLKIINPGEKAARFSDRNVYLSIGESRIIEFSILPAQDVIFDEIQSNIFTVEKLANGNCYVTCIGEGSGTLTGRGVNDTDVTDYCYIYGSAPTTGYIVIDPGIALNLNPYASVQVTGTINNSSETAITWETSNNQSVIIQPSTSQSGDIVNIVGQYQYPTNSIITAFSENDPNIKPAKLPVYLDYFPTDIQIQHYDEYMATDTEQDISYIVNPSQVSQEVVVTSSNPAIATIENLYPEYGTFFKVKAIAAGTVNFTVTSVVNPALSTTFSIIIPGAEIPIIDLEFFQNHYDTSTGIRINPYVQVTPQNATNQRINFAISGDTDKVAFYSGLAANDIGCILTGLDAGEVTITASAPDDSSISDTCTVSVTGEAIIPVTDIDLSSLNVTGIAGGQLIITGKVFPENATLKEVGVYQSLDTFETVGVSSSQTDDGISTNLSFYSPGETFVTFIAFGGQVNPINLPITVVNPNPITSITPVTPVTPVTEMFKGDVVTLEVAYEPADAFGAALQWNTNNYNNGNLNSDSTGIYGTSKNFVSYNYPETTDETIITVAPLGNTSVFYEFVIQMKEPEVYIDSVNIIPENPTLEVGEIMQFTAEILPTNASVQTALFYSDSNSIIGIDQITGVGRANNEGITNINAFANDSTLYPGGTTEATVTIPTGGIKFTELKIVTNNSGPLQPIVGYSTSINLRYYPTSALTSDSVTWASSDETVATITPTVWNNINQRQLNFISPGDVTISVTANDGSGVSDSVSITVIPDPTA